MRISSLRAKFATKRFHHIYGDSTSGRISIASKAILVQRRKTKKGNQQRVWLSPPLKFNFTQIPQNRTRKRLLHGVHYFSRNSSASIREAHAEIDVQIVDKEKTLLHIRAVTIV